MSNQHPDDLAVDKLAQAMKEKLAQKREQGYGGWQEASEEHLNNLLQKHLAKGDPVDIANFAMMLFNNGYKTKADRLEKLQRFADDLVEDALENAEMMDEGVLDNLVEHGLLQVTEVTAENHAEIGEPNGLDVGDSFYSKPAA